MSFSRFLVFVLLTVPVLHADHAPAVSPPAARTAAPEADRYRMIRQIVELTNEQRKSHGLAPLKLQHNLTDAAQWLADDMAVKDYFSHTDSEGRDVVDRVAAFGYRPVRLIAENIAAGTRTPQEAVERWMSSPEHRANLLHPEAEDMGVGYAVGEPDGERYWVQDFGSRFRF